MIIDNRTKEIKVVGKAHQGLYYLIDHLSGNVPASWLEIEPPKNSTTLTSSSNLATPTPAFTELDKWHHRLGHASAAKLKLIPCVQPFMHQPSKVCITCPMSKFTKLPYPLSDSHAKQPFALVHIDIWGPYKEFTRGKYKHFLTIVDDNTRHTWIYLLQFKSDALSAIQTF